MKLNEYLSKTARGATKQAKCERLAQQLGVSVHTVVKWANGQRGIKDNMKLQIQHFTNGQVRIADMVRR